MTFNVSDLNGHHGTQPAATPSLAPTAYDRTVARRWRPIARALVDLKRTLLAADQAALGNGGEIPEAAAARARAGFLAFFERVGHELRDDSVACEALGARLQAELLPFVLLTRNGERWYSKPRGYAGDFLSIEWFYENEAAGVGRLGPLLDRCLLDLPAGEAVRNRRGLLSQEIHQALAAAGSRPAEVLSMACGPARELIDVLVGLPEPARLRATCVDIDPQALAFVAEVGQRRGVLESLRLEQANLVHLVAGRRTLELPPLDLAYSIGLIDYFDDAFVVRLLDYVHARLRPGGRVILGNFHPRNPCKWLMDHVLGWKLVHRTEADMNRLFQASRFGRPCEEIRYEAQRINLFAIASRER